MSDFVWSIKNGDLEKVKECVEFSKCDVNSEVDGRYPIHFASDYGQLSVIEYLISKGAKVDVNDKHGISPLLAAIWEGHTECVKLLIEKGAKKDGKAPDGQSYAACAEKEEIKALLR